MQKKIEKCWRKEENSFVWRTEGVQGDDKEDDYDGDEVDDELVQAIRESKKIVYMNELRQWPVSGLPSCQYMPGDSSAHPGLGKCVSMRDNSIDLKREANRACKQMERTRSTGANIGNFSKFGNKKN